MKILICGTKYGFCHFYNQASDQKIFLSDIRDINISTSTIGSEAYALKIFEGNIMISKYKIIRDIAGDYRAGFICFTVIMPFGEKILSGKDAVALIDDIHKKYFEEYVPNNDNNLENKVEDFSFIDEITKNYTYSNSLSNYDWWSKAPIAYKDFAAYIYYNNQEELHKFFDKPLQPEYEYYQQVYFIASDYKEKDSNPLNALQHTTGKNLTDIVKIDNDVYTIVWKSNYASISVLDEEEKYYVRKGDVLNIKYSKKHHEDYKISVTIDNNTEQESEPDKVTINHNEKTITINDYDLTKKTVKLTILSPVDITLKNDKDDTKTIHDNQVVFEGDEIGYTWKVVSNPEKKLDRDVINPYSIGQFSTSTSRSITIKIIENTKPTDENNILKLSIFIFIGLLILAGLGFGIYGLFFYPDTPPPKEARVSTKDSLVIKNTGMKLNIDTLKYLSNKNISKEYKDTLENSIKIYNFIVKRKNNNSYLDSLKALKYYSSTQKEFKNYIDTVSVKAFQDQLQKIDSNTKEIDLNKIFVLSKPKPDAKKNTNNQSSSNQQKEYVDSSSVKTEKINKNSNDNCEKLKKKAIEILNNIYDDKQLDPDSKIKKSKAKLIKLYENKGCIKPSTIQQKAWSMEELFNLIENN